MQITDPWANQVLDWLLDNRTLNLILGTSDFPTDGTYNQTSTPTMAIDAADGAFNPADGRMKSNATLLAFTIPDGRPAPPATTYTTWAAVDVDSNTVITGGNLATPFPFDGSSSMEVQPGGLNLAAPVDLTSE